MLTYIFAYLHTRVPHTSLTCMSSYQAFPSELNSTPSEHPSKSTPLERAFLCFLKTNMAIPSYIISKISWQNITHSPGRSEVSVLFPSLRIVKTIFQHVKNLPAGDKVSPFIPQILESQYKTLKNKAYLLRHSDNPQKTVIRYQGSSLNLYARAPSSSTWHFVQTTNPEPMELGTSSPKNCQDLTMS